MFVITGTRHSGTLFLSSTLQTAGLTVQSRKKVLAGANVPPGAMVAVPIPKLPEISDRAEQVVALVRPWRAWAAIMTEEDPQPAVPHEVRWWFSNYALCCALVRAKARFMMLSHDKLLSRPELSIRRVLRFLDRGEAMETVLLLPAIAPSASAFHSRVFDRNQVEILDAYWDVVHNAKPMTRGIFRRMSLLQASLRSRYPQADAVEPMLDSELVRKVSA